jgi:hypothetical protein
MTQPDDVRKALDWDDPATYQWLFRNPKKEIAGFIGRLLGVLVLFPMLIYGIFCLISLLSPPAAVWLSFLATIFLFFCYGYAVWVRWAGKREDQLEASWNGPCCALAALGTLAYWVSCPTCFACGSFHGSEQAGVWEWFLFFFDNAVSTILFDIPGTMGLRCSTIAPNGLVSQGVTVLAKLLIVAGVVELAVICYRTAFQEERFYGTVRECYHKCQALPNGEEIEVVREGKVEMHDPPGKFPAEKITEALKERASAAT